MITSGKSDTSKSTSWKVLETVLSHLKSVKQKAERGFVEALTRFHYRHLERQKSKLNKEKSKGHRRKVPRHSCIQRQQIQGTILLILDTKTHFKPMETFQYTHFTSCHPPSVKNGFVKGECLRILRTNSSDATFDENISNFKKHLGDRGYPQNLIDKILSGKKFTGRTTALKQNKKERKEILPFVTQYQPSISNLKEALLKNWHLIQNQPRLRQIFKQPPILSYKRNL